VAILPSPPDPYKPITLEQAQEKLDTGAWDDEAALSLCLNDAARAESFESTKQWVTGHAQAVALYQSPYTARYWEGTLTEKASIPFFTVAKAINNLAPQIINGLFFDNPPFLIQNRPGTASEAARAVGAVQAFQLEDINFKEELRLGVINALLFGTTIWKWGWEQHTEQRKVYKRKSAAVSLPNTIPGSPNIQIPAADDDIEIVEEDEEIARPFFENVRNLRHVLVDPTLDVPDISKAKFLVHRRYMTWDELDTLRDRPGYKIPSREKLLELFLPPKEPVEAALGESGTKNPLYDMRAEPRFTEATTDPFKEPLEILERWDNEQYIVVLQKKLVIGKDANPYGKIPFFSVGWWDVPEAFYSIGLAKTIGSEQMLQQGVTNTWLDFTALLLNGVYTRVEGSSVPTQSIRIAPGKIINVKSKDDMQPLNRFSAVPEAGIQLEMSNNRVEQLAGAGALNTVGPSAGHSNLARTAAGANLLGGSNTTGPDFVEKLCSQVIVPFLYRMQEMNAALLPASTWTKILNDDLQHEYAKNNSDVIALLNARVKFSVLAGSKMTARQQMSQSLPILIQFLTNEQTLEQLATAGYRVDVVELQKMVFEVSQWKNFNDVVVKMTPEEQQRYMELNSPQAKIQAQGQVQAQVMDKKKNDQLELIDAENQARAGREILRAAINHPDKGVIPGFGG
jgi:hypothetical protein